MEKRSFAALDGAAELVGYEALLLGVAGLRCDQAQRDRDDALALLLCETFLLHARNLIEFLLASALREDTVTASDYVADWDEVDKGEHAARLLAQRSRIHKWVSHTTFDRLGDNDAWATGQIFNDLMHVGAQFLERVTGSPFEPAFNGLASMVEGATPRPARETRFLPRRVGEQQPGPANPHGERRG